MLMIILLGVNHMSFMLKLTDLLKPFFKPFSSDDLWYALRNETDGFAATTLHPHEIGLSVYMIFNCYACYHCAVKPRKHKTMIVEIAKDLGGNKLRSNYFNWNETIPIEVSSTPNILLRGKKLKRALSLFTQQEWEDIYIYVAQNRHVIKRHWIGETDSLGLFDELKNHSERQRD